MKKTAENLRFVPFDPSNLKTNTMLLSKPCFFFLLLLSCFWANAQAPSANFTASQMSGCVPLIVSFNDQSTGNPTAWQWDFGNGVTSTLQNPSTTYFTEGTYTVRLTVTNANGSNTVTRQGLITIHENPTVYFSADKTQSCFPTNLTFKDSSAAGKNSSIVAWQWDFGNGTQSAAQAPVVRFTQAGNYSVGLKVTNDKGCSASGYKSSYIRISGRVSASFTNSAIDRCYAPFPVQFNNTSTGPGTLTYTWSFGDGNSSQARDPGQVYTTTGNYTVSLAVTSSEGCSDTVRKADLFVLPAITTSFAVPDTVCAATPQLFTSTSTPAAAGTLWLLGDGTQATSANVGKSYATAGLYTVQMIKRYNHCSDTLTKNVRALPRPQTQFSAIDTTSCKPPLTVTFRDATTTAVRWAWDFGDGQTSNAQNPVHTYTDYGDYNVTLVTTNSEGCSDTLTQNAFVKIRRPVISLPSLPQQGCLPYNASFTSDITTLDVVATYIWDFGDGGSGTGASPSHTYTVQGSYPVSLTITTTGGCTETLKVPNAITVGRRPVVDFTASTDTICVEQGVSFIGITSEGNIWEWNIPGVGTSAVQNPTFNFTRPGLYDVSLTVTNSGCRETVTKTQFINVKPPLAGLSLRRDCGSSKRYLFRDESVNATGWLWEFGDGFTSTDQHPAHLYNDYGNYTITLTVTNGACTHKTVRYLSVSPSDITFTADTTVACKTASIQYKSNVADPTKIVAYRWDFSNGTSSDVANPVAIYANSGTFSTRVVAIDIYGCQDTAVRSNYIRINGPTARFTATNNVGCSGITATFTDNSTSDGIHAITNWFWSYGDSATQSLNNGSPRQHLYQNAGNYNVQLTLTDAAGCKDSLRLADLVRTSVPKAAFVAIDSMSCLGSTVQFNNQSSALNYSSEWTFGTGASSSLTNPTYQYADTGRYTVRLKITDVNGCSDSVTKMNYITIAKTVAAFKASDTVGTCLPYQVFFTNNSQFYVNSNWNFSAGSSSLHNPSHTYFEPGTYPVTLYVTGRGGCVDSAKSSITIYPDSATTISYTPIEGCKPVMLQATVNVPAVKNFTWDFGDGTLVKTRDKETTHTYSALGNFLPRLILVDSGNCLLPYTGTDSVIVRGADVRFGWNRQLFCDSGSVAFTDSTKFNDNSMSWNWNFGDGATSPLQHPVHQYQRPGLYTVSLVAQTSSGCSDTLTYSNQIAVVESPSIAIFGDTAVCQNNPVVHTGVMLRPDTSAVRWSWQFPNGNTSTMIRPPIQQYGTPGNYVIRAVAVNSSGCTDTTFKALRVNALPTVAVPTSLSAPVGTSITIQPTRYGAGVVSYLWSPAEGLSCTTCPQPDARPSKTTTYQVQVTDNNGCRNTAEVQVVVFCKNSNVFVPNTFSPNGDGSNDVFYVRGSGLARVKSLRIFNRWGELIFQKRDFAVNDISTGWDGTYNGRTLEPDTYIYQVDVFCENSESVRFDGSLALIR